MSELGEKKAGLADVLLCYALRREQERKWFSLDTFIDRSTVGAFSSKPVSWFRKPGKNQGWSSGKHEVCF